MAQDLVKQISGGVNQRGVRDYNERLLLSMIQRSGPTPGSDLARMAGLSAQTVSVILRSLESEGLVQRGKPQRGKVGKPSVPMELNPSGAFSIGLKIGRRTADLALMDLSGTIRHQMQATYRYPMPDTVFDFLKSGLEQITHELPPKEAARVCGIGIAAPFEIWKWGEIIGAPQEAFQAWKDIYFAEQVARFSDLPVVMGNDATAACRAEHVFGLGKQFRDYAYFFVGSFIGGGVVLNHAVFDGSFGNAGALGSLQSVTASGKSVQLIDTASLYLLESTLEEAGLDPMALWTGQGDWSEFETHLGPWLDQATREIAKASLSACAVIDFEAVIIDGAFPPDVRARLVASVRQHIERLDTRGLVTPRIEEGQVGGNARVMGAAYGPIAAQHFLVANPGLAKTA